MLDQVGEELPAGVLHQVVEADAGADKDFLDLGQLPQLPQEHHIVGVVGVQVGTGLRGQAGPIFTQAVLELFLTGGVPEGGGGTAHVVDVALESPGAG